LAVSVIKSDRLQRIKEYVAKNGRATIAELGAFVRASQATVRRDIDHLASEGAIVRLHGGACWPEAPRLEPPVLQRAGVCSEEKRRIGMAASTLIGDGETVFLGSGSTVLELARNLRGREGLTIITNSLPVLNVLADSPGIKVIVTGGFLRYDELSFIGHLVEKTLRDLRADKVVIGIQGIHLEHGLTNEYLPEALSDRAIIGFSRTVIVVADSTKFGKVKPSFVCELDVVSRIVTDAGAPPEMIGELDRRGIPVMTVEGRAAQG
jgi:DeoR/GlpR family transcriptional regulator of sugar metabolism